MSNLTAMLERAKYICWLALKIPEIVMAGIFGSLAEGRSEIGDIDIVIFIESPELPERILEEAERTSGHIYGDQLKHLIDPTQLDVVDQIYALITCWEVEVDVIIIPRNPSEEYLEGFYALSTDPRFLRHIANVLKVFDPDAWEFSSFQVSWVKHVQTLTWLDEATIFGE